MRIVFVDHEPNHDRNSCYIGYFSVSNYSMSNYSVYSREKESEGEEEHKEWGEKVRGGGSERDC